MGGPAGVRASAPAASRLRRPQIATASAQAGVRHMKDARIAFS
jgi:hypothetical protein